jgi:hypothetical protein
MVRELLAKHAFDAIACHRIAHLSRNRQTKTRRTHIIHFVAGKDVHDQMATRCGPSAPIHRIEVP